VTHPLQLSRSVVGQLLVHVQMRMLLDDHEAGVVLYVEQVLHVLGHLCPSNAELRTGEVARGLKALAPLGLLLIMDREQCDLRVGGVSEPSLAQGSECHMSHLLSSVINLTPDDGSSHGAVGSTGISTRTSQQFRSSA
jgi:hypothetical protein